jgi:hypothetical protein
MMEEDKTATTTRQKMREWKITMNSNHHHHHRCHPNEPAFISS